MARKFLALGSSWVYNNRNFSWGLRMGTEFELKYRADAEKIAAIRKKYGSFQSISMETTYYDTPDRRLGKRHWTLRRRFENGTSVCTVKTPSKDGGRGEWEMECADILEAIPVLCDLGAPAPLISLTIDGVEEVCGARFTRLAKLVELEDCTVEIALDEGSLLGGGREIPLCEVEVELKSGSQEAAVAFAKALAAEFGLKPETASKFKRALDLAEIK